MLPRLILLLTVAAAAIGQPQTPPLENEQRTRWFTDAKFGISIHWGPYSVIGRSEWARQKFQIPQQEYDKYARAFNPVNFNADQWTNLIQSSGAKYIVITSKHHDGFSLYRSNVSDYDMRITPYPGDPLKDLARSARQSGLKLGFYYSIMDWHNLEYLPKRAWETEPPAPKIPNVNTPKATGDFNAYIDFMKKQLNELLTNYSDVAMLWFDGDWEHSTAEMRSDEIFDFIRSQQPNTLINDRLFKRTPGNRADFATPEQLTPSNFKGKPMPWEWRTSINGDGLGYNQYETEFKTARELIRTLIRVSSAGGNLLLNIGPTPDGRIQPEFETRLAEIGHWMAVNGDAIYGTTASPFPRLPFFGHATAKGNTLYLHIFEWPKDGKLRVPGLRNIVQSARLLADPKKLLQTEKDGDDIIVSLPAAAPDEVATVVELNLDGTPTVEPFRLKPAEDGTITLTAASADIEPSFGQKAKKENALGHVFLMQWTGSDEAAYWPAYPLKSGKYEVEIQYGASRARAGSEFTISVGNEKVTGKVEDTGGNYVFKTFKIGTLRLKAGQQDIKVTGKMQGEVMNLEAVILKPAR